MPLWQIALAVLVVAWALQALGTYVQMRHYTQVMGEVSRTFSDGFLGAGNGRTRFGAGVILLLVVGPDRVVRRLMIMRGRSVFARFVRIPEAEGKAIAALDADPALRDIASRGALNVAMLQIEKAASRLPKSAVAAA